MASRSIIKKHFGTKSKSLLFQHAGKTTFVNVIASGQFNEVELKLTDWFWDMIPIVGFYTSVIYIV